MSSAILGAACDVSLKVTHTLLKKFFNGFEKELAKSYGLQAVRSEEFTEACRSSRIESV